MKNGLLFLGLNGETRTFKKLIGEYDRCGNVKIHYPFKEDENEKQGTAFSAFAVEEGEQRGMIKIYIVRISNKKIDEIIMEKTFPAKEFSIDIY